MTVIFPSFSGLLWLNLSPLLFSNEFLCLLFALLVVVRVRDLPVVLDEVERDLSELEFLFVSLGALGLVEDVVVREEGREDLALL